MYFVYILRLFEYWLLLWFFIKVQFDLIVLDVIILLHMFLILLFRLITRKVHLFAFFQEQLKRFITGSPAT